MRCALEYLPEAPTAGTDGAAEASEAPAAAASAAPAPAPARAAAAPSPVARAPAAAPSRSAPAAAAAGAEASVKTGASATAAPPRGASARQSDAPAEPAADGPAPARGAAHVNCRGHTHVVPLVAGVTLVSELRRRLEALTGVAASRQRLVARGKLLADDEVRARPARPLSLLGNVRALSDTL